MSNAYIKLVPVSTKLVITIEEVKELLTYYQEITSKTGQQLDWGYSEAAFPYQIKDIKENVIQLKSDDPKYHSILIGVGTEANQGEEQEQRYFIQVTLPAMSTNGDKAKANELCKFLGKKLEGEVHLFNQRVMYYYKRK